MSDTKYTGPFNNFRGGFRIGYGFKPDGDTNFPLVESCDIQATADGKRLDEVLNSLVESTDPVNLEAELEEQAALIAQIRAKLRAKISGGGGIVSIEKTSSEGLVDTYTITFTDGSTSTFTVTNGKSAFDYAKDAGYTGTESSFVAQLTGTSMVGSWTFIDDPDLTTLPDESTELSFISNGTEYSAIKRGVVGPSNLSIYGMYYGNRAVYVNSPDENDGITHGWSNDAYKTITITKEPSDSSIVAWIKENAEMVGTPSKRLKTRNKRVVDAINELNDKLDETGVEQIKSIDTWASGVRELYTDNGIYWSEGFELYNQTELTGDVVAYGDITHRVPIVPGNNVTFEIDAENEVVKINAIGGSSGTGENSIVGTWVFNESITNLARIAGEDKGYAVNFTSYCPYGFGNEYTTLSFGFVGNSFNYNRNGPSVTAYDFNTSTWADEQLRTITILSQTDDEEFIEWLNTNATKQEENNADGGASFALPMIRFANCTLIGDEEIGDLMYRFTVENLGGGTLQEGDKLQICCKRTYPNKKQKLRMMAEYIITEDDINQRFLKIEVDPSEEPVQMWLFRNNRCGFNHSTLSAIYFRLKRVTAYGGDDRECNAIFSNIEEVWKTYRIINGTPSIYSLKIK